MGTNIIDLEHIDVTFQTGKTKLFKPLRMSPCKLKKATSMG